jgi:uncharacterized protein (TIGR02594 family)
MIINRRNFLTGALAFLATGACADDRVEYSEYPFVDYFSLRTRGLSQGTSPDIAAAMRIASSMPTNNHFAVMESLSQITETGSTGEVFNSRWKKIANPLIILFFHEIGYKETHRPGDCTPWCAATVAWCLKRTGMSIPSNPASSQSYLQYGDRVTDPRPGDLCIFAGVNDTSAGHVGLYVYRVGDKLRVLGGNQTGQSATNCGPGYRQSKICITEIPINRDRSPSVGVHYLSAYVRPV